MKPSRGRKPLSINGERLNLKMLEVLYVLALAEKPLNPEEILTVLRGTKAFTASRWKTVGILGVLAYLIETQQRGLSTGDDWKRGHPPGNIKNFPRWSIVPKFRREVLRHLRTNW